MINCTNHPLLTLIFLTIFYSTIFILIGTYFFNSSITRSLIYGWVFFAILSYLYFIFGMTLVDTPGIGFNYPPNTRWYTYN